MEDKNKKNNYKKDISEQIFDMVTDSIEAMDFSSLSERIRDTFQETRDEINRQLDSLQKGYYTPSNRNRYGKAQRRRNYSHPGGRYRKNTSTEIVVSEKKLPGTYSGPLQIAAGGLGLTIFGGISLGFGLAGIISGFGAGIISTAAVVVESIFIPLTVASGVFLGKGFFTRNRLRRFREYAEKWKNRSFIMLSDLSDQTGQSVDQIRQDVNYLIDHEGIPGARLDQEQTCLMLDDEAISQYEAAKESQRLREEEERRRQEEESRWSTASEEERDMHLFIQQAEETMTELDRYKQSILAEAMTGRLERLELLLTRIFVCVKEHPEKLRLTRRLMNYYLPSVMKLLSVYEDLEKQPIQGDTIQKTRGEIEGSLDTINEALESMFDELFQEEALDISADIQVLRTLLIQDGWIDNK